MNRINNQNVGFRSVAVIAGFIFCVVAVDASIAVGQVDSAGGFRPKFYAFQNGVSFGDAAKDAKALKQLGYHGVAQVYVTGDDLAQRIAAYDKAGLEVLSVYLNVDSQPIQADAVRPLANRRAMIELTVQKMTPSTIEAVRETAEMAADLNIRVAIYPHHGFAVATMPQAMSLIQKVNHPNLGVMFNLCHFLRNERAEDLERVLTDAGPRLFAASTAGADVGGRAWGELIQPLDRGSFPQTRLLQQLKKQGFGGPVSLQCFGVPGDKRENLERSIAAWRRTLAELE